MSYNAENMCSFCIRLIFVLKRLLYRPKWRGAETNCQGYGLSSHEANIMYDIMCTSCYYR